MAISTLYLQVVPLDDSTRSDYICILVAALSFRNYARGTSKKSRDRGRIVRKNDPPCINPYPAAITPRVTVKPCAYRVPRVLPRKKREEKKEKERRCEDNEKLMGRREREAMETRGIIIFEHLPRLLPLLLLRLRFGSPSRAVDTRFSRNNITVIIFTFGPFARIPHKWHGPAINCHDRQLPDRPSVRSGINGNARACESARVRPRLFSRFPRLSLDNCF